MRNLLERLFSNPAAVERTLLEAELSHDDIRNQLATALRAERVASGITSGGYLYPREVYDEYLVYSVETPDGDKLFKRSYSIDDAGNVTLDSDTVEVKAETVYTPIATTPATEASRPSDEQLTEAQLTGDIIPLVEKSVRRDGTVPVKIIQPGWGSSGYYGAEMLERDGPKVFTKGLKMYWDHPTATDEAERPERSLRDLAAELVSDARYDANGTAGAGLYADAKVFGDYKEAVEELAPHIGVSIRALGRATSGTAEGKSGPVIESLVGAQSVDFVTTPGAGGQVLQLFEAAGRGRASTPTTPRQEDTPVPEELSEAVRQRLEAQDTEIARLREAAILREARDIVSAIVNGHDDLLDATRARLIESASKNPPVKDNALDREALTTRTEESVKTEIEYLAKVAGIGDGRVRGMGGSGSSEPLSEADATKALAGLFGEIGMSESAAKIAAGGRSH